MNARIRYSLRRIAVALGYPCAVADRLADMMEGYPTVEDALDNQGDFREEYLAGGDTKRIIDYYLEGDV